MYGKCAGIRVMGNITVTGVIDLPKDERLSTRAAWTKADNRFMGKIWKECRTREGLNEVSEQRLADQVSQIKLILSKM